MTNIILASGSPRRKEILTTHGLSHQVIVPDAKETVPTYSKNRLDVRQTVMFFALKKALTVYEQLDKNVENDLNIILAADTVVYKDKIIGKPADRNEAIASLNLLKDTNHHVITGVALINTYDGSKSILHDVTEVTFGNYTEEDINEYIDKDPPWDKAGAYAIQSQWHKHVIQISGDMENVIGLPYYRIKDYLKRA